jgi:hypothetical protein
MKIFGNLQMHNKVTRSKNQQFEFFWTTLTFERQQTATDFFFRKNQFLFS